jgi:hypothetical protein
VVDKRNAEERQERLLKLAHIEHPDRFGSRPI